MKLTIIISWALTHYGHCEHLEHTQKFKDPRSSTCQLSPERRVLELESEVNQRPGFGPHRGNILSLEFLFSLSKASDVNIGIIANVMCL